MSLSIVLVPLAVAVSLTTVEAYNSIKNKLNKTTECELETKFASKNLLFQTLTEHGILITENSENYIVAQCPGGTLIYSRNNSNEAFKLNITSVCEMDLLISELQLLNDEYNLNVQEYTYDRIKKNLEENMTIENEEILDDNSILLTIAID